MIPISAARRKRAQVLITAITKNDPLYITSAVTIAVTALVLVYVIRQLLVAEKYCSAEMPYFIISTISALNVSLLEA